MNSPSFVELFSSHEGYICDKWEQYLPVYDAEVGQLVARAKPLSLLEIGVQNGGSLEIWAKLLPAGSEILGIDIDPRCAELALPANVRVLIGDAANREFLDAALGERTFDIIIDDGSHRSSDVIASFKHLFPRLRSSGKYFIEDLHASYWDEFGGGFRKDDSAIEFLKSLIDALHVDHVRDLPAIDAGERAALIAFNRQIARLSFCDSLAVIEKYRQEKTGQFVRMIAGTVLDEASPAWHRYLAQWTSPIAFPSDTMRDAMDSTSRRQAARLTAENAEIQARLLDAQRALAEVEASRETTLAENADLQAKLQHAQRALAEAEAARESSVAENADMQAKLQHAQRALAEAEAARESSSAEWGRKTEALQGELEKERNRSARLRRALTVVREKNTQLHGRLRAIKSSWSWRWSRPVRRMVRALRRHKAE